MIKLKVFILCFIFTASGAHALRCAPLPVPKIAYLAQIVSIDSSFSKKRQNKHSDMMDLKRQARIKVHKIYVGDTDRLSRLDTIEFSANCADYANKSTGMAYALSCESAERLGNTYKVGEMIIVLNSEKGISLGPCVFPRTGMKTKEDLADFEKKYKPIWQSPTWDQDIDKLFGSEK